MIVAGWKVKISVTVSLSAEKSAARFFSPVNEWKI